MRKRHKSIHEKHNGINERMNDSMLGLRRNIHIFQTWKKDCQGFSHNTTNGDPNSLTQIQVRSSKPHYKRFHNFSTRLIKNHFSKWKIRKLFKQCPIVLSSQLSNLTYTFNHKQKNKHIAMYSNSILKKARFYNYRE